MTSRSHYLRPSLCALILFLISPTTISSSAQSPATSPMAEAGAVGTDAGWWKTVSAQIAHDEYRATPVADGLQAPNRAQGLRALFRTGTVVVEPRQTSGSDNEAWSVGWSTTGWGREGHLRTVDPVAPRAECAASRVSYAYPGLDEWYENTEAGLEQGFTVQSRPSGDGGLCLVGRFQGAFRVRRREDGALDLVDEGGACILRYGDLHVSDARGNSLPADLSIEGDELAILVDDHAAEYPITIDPLLTSPAWTAESNAASGEFGLTVGTAGDVNGDGYSDVIVGAPLAVTSGGFEGKVYVFLGSATGLSTSPSWIKDSDQVGAAFGYSVGTAGDVNGDGYSDVVLSADSYTNGEFSEGRVYVFQGSAAGLATSPAWITEGNQASAFYGESVGTAGDVNGDGYSDVIVGADLYSNGEGNEGRAYVYLGSASGLTLSAAWTAESNQNQGQMGHSVGTAGDVNGDGYSDVIVGVPGYSNGQSNEGRACVYLGSSTGLAASPAWTPESDQAGAYFGNSVGTAGDVNGDGYSDVIVGSLFFDNGQTDEGKAFAYYGSSSGLVTVPAWTAEGNQISAGFGFSVGTAGDVNGDGYADVIVGAYQFDNMQTDEGRAFVYHGSATGLTVIARWTAESDQDGANFGWSVGTAGDVNGDGYSDVIVGAPYYDNGQTDEGRAYVYHGAAAGLALSSGWSAEGDQDQAGFGYSVACAGDVNGDGYSDVIVGAQNYDNGETNEGRAFLYPGSAIGLATSPTWTAESNQPNALFGYSVAGAGDVNGDGYSDVIVGSPSYDNGQTDEGRAFVYHGSALGLATSFAWSAESNQGGAGFGNSVGRAGDVNGDGYSDVIVGVPGYSTSGSVEGEALVYQGSPTGLAINAAWVAYGDNNFDGFGKSVGTAGDVNRDGYSDVIVGAYQYDDGETDEGRAFVFNGSSSGLATSFSWSAESNQASAFFGYSVGTAGDVNGDGYSDVIVGAYNYDNGQTDEGRAYVYHGSGTGLATTANWTAESDQPSGSFGWSVGTAGDVNGDGYSDVIVGSVIYSNGETNEGRAYVYQGSPTGLATTSAWTSESNQAFANYGFSVGTAGDVNGDGYSDVIVSSYFYDNGQTDEGKVFVYYGNGGGGFDRIARQARANDSAPISLLGRSDVFAFNLKALGRTPAGRGKVRLQWELKPFGTPFNGTGLTKGSALDTGTPVPGTGSAVPLSGFASGLTPGTLYHWRARIVTDSPYFPHSPWLWLSGNGAAEADLRSAPATIGIEASADAPRFFLGASSPNPFSVATRLGYTLPEPGRVRLAIYDISGREVAVLAEGMEGSGTHTQTWDGRGRDGTRLPTGVYFARLAFGGQMETGKVVLSR